MIDVTGPKVLLPAALFVALSPGLLLQLPSTKLNSGLTSKTSVLFHSLVFIILYSIVARLLKLVLTPTDLIVPTILFVLLSPGVLLTLPPGSNGVFASGQTSMGSIMVHALVFAVVFALIRKQFPAYY
jgi:Protein of unknown function (DUF3339)